MIHAASEIPLLPSFRSLLPLRPSPFDTVTMVEQTALIEALADTACVVEAAGPDGHVYRARLANDLRIV
jgi:hypothetical protein